MTKWTSQMRSGKKKNKEQKINHFNFNHYVPSSMFPSPTSLARTVAVLAVFANSARDFITHVLASREIVRDLLSWGLESRVCSPMSGAHGKRKCTWLWILPREKEREYASGFIFTQRRGFWCGVARCPALTQEQILSKKGAWRLC